MKKTISYLILSLLQLFSFSTFTISAQNLYIGSFYVTTTDEGRLYGDGKDNWSTRRPIICDMFNFEQADVVGLQSLTSAQLSALRTYMRSYYTFAGDIFYNKNTIELISNGIVEEMPEGSTCTWAKLQREGSAFYVFNICFSTEATVASSSATRVRNAINEINTENLPCFIVGFLGVNSSKTAYTKLNSGGYPDTYTKAPVISAESGTVNNFDLEANHGTDRYDFVFASKTVTVNAYGQLQYGYYTQESDGYKRRLPSTHFPVMVKVTLP